MSKASDARKAQLKKQLKDAVVEHVGTPLGTPGYDPDYWSVFIPGAIREQNFVSAKNEAEAKKKTRLCLERKIEAMPDELGEPVEIKPDNLKIKTSSKITFKETK